MPYYASWAKRRAQSRSPNVRFHSVHVDSIVSLTQPAGSPPLSGTPSEALRSMRTLVFTLQCELALDGALREAAGQGLGHVGCTGRRLVAV